jgi:hypothetical protein
VNYAAKNTALRSRKAAQTLAARGIHPRGKAYGGTGGVAKASPPTVEERRKFRKEQEDN